MTANGAFYSILMLSLSNNEWIVGGIKERSADQSRSAENDDGAGRLTSHEQLASQFTTWAGAPALKARTLSMAIASPASVASRVMPAA